MGFDPRIELAELTSKNDRLIQNVKAANRDLTDAEARQMAVDADRITVLKASILRGEKNTGTHIDPNPGTGFDAGVNGRSAFADEDETGYLNTSVAGVKSAIRAGLGGREVKSVIADGSIVVPTQLESEVILKARETNVGLLDRFGVTKRSTENYRVIREKTVDNQAAIWTSGDKAESTYEVESVDSALKTFAHTLAEPVPVYLLKDAPSIERYLTGAMTRGLYEAVSDYLVTRVTTQSGIQTVAAESEALASIYAGQLAIDTLGYQAGVVILHPDTWKTLATTRNSSGAFDVSLGGPVGTGATAPANTLFNVPVALSRSVDANQAVVLDTSVVGLSTDTQGVDVAFDPYGANFKKNLVDIRVEGRFEVDLFSPAGIALVTLTDTP